MFEKLGDKLFSKLMLMLGAAAVLEFSYLAVLGTFTNPETGAVNQTIAENLEFWGPILEFLIGAPYLLALVFAFVVCLAAQDISLLVLVIFLVPTLSLAISIVAPYFTMAFVMDTITLGMGTEIAMEGAAASSVAMAMAGPTASAAVGCYYAFLQVAFAAVAVLFESLFFFSRMK